MKKKFRTETGPLKDLFHFTRSEQRGILVMLGLLVLVFSSDMLLSRALPEPDASFEIFRQDIIKFEESLKAGPPDAAGGDSLQKTGRTRTPSFTILLNEADTFDLQRLPGIGPGFARRIIAYRERLGGFISKSQLLEVYGMDSARYHRIERFIMPGSSTIRTISVNKATFKELLRHPYFHFNLAREVMLCRKKLQRFSDMKEIREIPGMTDSIFRRLHPYLRLDP